MNTLIKICGIKDSNTAAATAKAGADFIGMIFVASSRRRVSFADVPRIVQSSRDNGAEPVAVFTEENAEQITAFCQLMQIKYAQLHGEGSRSAQKELPAEIHRIFSCRVDADGVLNAQDLQYAENLQADRDFMLFDSVQPGSGHTFNWQKFSYSGKLRWFLAGGLNVSNVEQAIQNLQPPGVDVSSGVEDSLGNKDLQLIKNFIKKCENQQ